MDRQAKEPNGTGRLAGRAHLEWKLHLHKRRLHCNICAKNSRRFAVSLSCAAVLVTTGEVMFSFLPCTSSAVVYYVPTTSHEVYVDTYRTRSFEYNVDRMSTDFLIGKYMGSRISKLFNGLILYVLSLLTFRIPVAEEGLFLHQTQASTGIMHISHIFLWGGLIVYISHIFLWGTL